MKTWRRTARGHMWEGDAGQVSIPPAPSDPQLEWSTSHLQWFSPCSLFYLLTALSGAHGEPMGVGALEKPGFARPHPHSVAIPASTAQP